jgi:HEAT repeat protein
MGRDDPQALLRALDDDDGDARRAVARSLAAGAKDVACRPEGEQQAFVATLRGRIAGERDAVVRTHLVVTLVRLGGDALLREIARALRSADAHVVAGAARVLGEVGDRRVVPNLVDAFRTEDVVVGAAIAGALGALGDPVVVPWLVAAAAQGFCVEACCRALGHLGDRRALPILQARAGDDDERVRLAAREALFRFAERGLPQTDDDDAPRGPGHRR